jgi:hypothetical protein
MRVGDRGVVDSRIHANTSVERIETESRRGTREKERGRTLDCDL